MYIASRLLSTDSQQKAASFTTIPSVDEQQIK